MEIYQQGEEKKKSGLSVCLKFEGNWEMWMFFLLSFPFYVSFGSQNHEICFNQR